MKKIIILLSCIYFSILNISFSDNYEKIHIMYDTEIDNIIKDISLPLVKYSGVRGEVKLWMINDKNINAFTTFGRNIYLNTG